MSKKTHILPDTLIKRLQAERDEANRAVENINEQYRKTISLLLEGYCATLDQTKKYVLTEDLTQLTEDG